MERELAEQRERPPELASSRRWGRGGADGLGRSRSPALVPGRGAVDVLGELRPGHRAMDGSGRGGTSSERRERGRRERKKGWRPATFSSNKFHPKELMHFSLWSLCLVSGVWFKRTKRD
jgi:hypothetical protein